MVSLNGVTGIPAPPPENSVREVPDVAGEGATATKFSEKFFVKKFATLGADADVVSSHLDGWP